MNLIKSLMVWYDNLSSSKKETILFILNYIFNAIPISLFVYLVMSLWMDYSTLRFLSTYICTTIFLVYFEHYYVWIRSEWNKK
jgi:heme/copper-type cytochrome/quinol oxidase subunit 4